jgi:hypothetical protein
MSNTAQLKALGMILEGASTLAFSLYNDSREEQLEGGLDKLAKVLGFDIRTGPGPASDTSKGSKPEAPADEVSTGSTGDTAVATAETATETATETETKLDSVLALLNDERYTLRTAKSIEEKTGLSLSDVKALLDENGIAYVVKHKRNNRNAKLVGLAARN